MLAVNCLRMINELMSFSKLERKTDFDASNCYKKKNSNKPPATAKEMAKKNKSKKHNKI